MAKKDRRRNTKYNWDKLEPKIFALRKDGRSYKDISESVFIKAGTLFWWFKHEDVQKRYKAFCVGQIYKEEPICTEKSVRKEDTRRDHGVSHSPVSNGFRERCEKFKSALRIGAKVKNYRTGDSGVIIGIYPDVFTIRTDGGWPTSFKYTDHVAFTKKAKEESEIWI